MKNIYLINYSVKGIKSLDEDVKLSFYKKTISKDQILEMYMNNVYLGSGAYGVEGAAEIYFNKKLKEIEKEETEAEQECKYAYIENDKLSETEIETLRSLLSKSSKKGGD